MLPQIVHPVRAHRTPAARAGRTGSPSRTGLPVSSGASSASASDSSSRIGSTCGECEATSTAISRAITSRCSHAATSSRTVWVAPPITVDCGEATTATTTSLTPRAISSESTCWAGSSTDAIAPEPAMRAISRERRQMTRTPSSSDSAPATTAAAASPERMPDDRARAHPVGLHGGGERDLHGEQRRLDPIDAGHDLRARTSPRSPRTRTREAISGSICGDGGGEHRFVRQQLSAHLRPTANPARRTPTPDPGHRARPRPDTEYRRRRPPAEPRVSSGRLLAMTAVRTGRCARRRARV